MPPNPRFLIQWTLMTAAIVPLHAANPMVRDILPVTGIVLSNPNSGGGTGVSDRTSQNQFEASGQTIESTNLDGTQVGIETLFLRVAAGTTIPVAGTYEIDIWIGEWNTGNDSPGPTVARQSFDVAGMEFIDDKIYGFTFDTPFDLAAGNDHAFQVWWTSDDDSHRITWDRDTGQGSVDGGFMDEKASNLSLPFSAKPNNNTDLYFFAFQVPEPSQCTLLAIGLGLSCWRRRRPAPVAHKPQRC